MQADDKMKEEDNEFLYRAADALISEATLGGTVDPAIKELLKRLDLLKNNNKRDIIGLPSGDAVNDNIPRNSEGYLQRVLYLLGKEHSERFQTTILQSHEPTDLINRDDTDKKEDKVTSSIRPSILSKTKDGDADTQTERPYKCSDCEMAFFRSSDLRRHEKIHLPILPNICPQCGKGFARKDALKRHFNTLTCRRNRNKLLHLGEVDSKGTITN